LWSRLSEVRGFYFAAQNGPGSQTDWSGEAEGTVEVEQPADDKLIFYEHGIYQTPHGKALQMRNVYQWELAADGVHLSHLRHEQPVFLFSLSPVDAAGLRWQTDEPHVCGADLYQATLQLEADTLLLDWTITGPRKNERVAYSYSGTGPAA